MRVAFSLTLGSNVLSRICEHLVNMKFVKALNHQDRKAGDHDCPHMAGETLRLREQ